MALGVPKFLREEAGREEDSAVVTGYISHRRTVQREDPRVMENYCQTGGLNPNKGNGNMCLSGLYSCDGPVIIVYNLPFFFSFLSFLYKNIYLMSPTTVFWVYGR